MSFNQKTTICREGWYFLALWSVVFGWALLRQENLLIALAGMMLGPVLFNRRWVAKSLRGLEVRRQVPTSIYAGQTLAVRLELENARQKGSSFGIEVRDSIGRQAVVEPVGVDEIETHLTAGSERSGAHNHTRGLRKLSFPSAGGFFLCVPAGSSSRKLYDLRLKRRGRYVFGPIEISTRFPFGMFRRTATVIKPASVLVFPRLGRLTECWAFRHREAIEGLYGSRRPGRAPGDFFGVRPWQSGDSQRWIHWRSSAKRGTLVVRQFERPRRHDVAVLVELWQPSSATEDDRQHVERAVSFAATLAADLCRRREGVLMLGIAASQIAWVHGEASPAILHQALEQLAVAEACESDRLPALCENHLSWLRSSSELVVVTTRPQIEHSLTSLRSGRRSSGSGDQEIRTISVTRPEFADYFQEAE